MDLCNKKCYANCDFCQYAISENIPTDEELLIHDWEVIGCKLGDNYYRQACARKEGLFCENFKCIMLDHEEYANTHIHTPLEDYISNMM